MTVPTNMTMEDLARERLEHMLKQRIEIERLREKVRKMADAGDELAEWIKAFREEPRSVSVQKDLDQWQEAKR